MNDIFSYCQVFFCSDSVSEYPYLRKLNGKSDLYDSSDLIQTCSFYLVEVATGSSQKCCLQTSCVGNYE